jgi:4-amino-4-deoxy-L-arabinose transferase-like glycosyltransferase
MPGRRSFLYLLLALCAAKLLLTVLVPPFGDEVFYWQEGRHLAFAYTDLPPLTAWLIRLGCALFGDNLFGLRVAFVACGIATVWVLLRWAEERGHDVSRTATLVPALPLLALSGQLATADAPLTLAFVLAARALDRALDHDRWPDWLLFGAALAIAWLAHWRAAMLYPVGLLLLAISPRARRAAVGPRFWIAQGIGLLGLVPTLWFNATHDWVGLRFQAVERHAWTFAPSSLLQPLEQALSVGVLLYPLLLWAMWRAWQRRREPGVDVIAALSIAVAVGYFVAGLFADAERTRFHWPLPAYLPLLLLLTAVTGPLASLLRWARLTGYAASLALAALLVSFDHAGDRWPPGDEHRIGEPFLGWDVAAAGTKRLLATMPDSTVLVADNFLLAAQLDFALRGTRPVYVLDHPRNRKHGRQPQLAIWQRDQAALKTAASAPMLLVVEENALYGADTLGFYRQLCRDFASARRVEETALFGTGKRFLWFELEVGAERRCELPPQTYLNLPTQDLSVAAGSGFTLSGWAVQEPGGIEAFEVMIDDVVDAEASTAFGVPATYVRDVWPDLVDARWPRVGFFREGVGRGLARGTHTVEVRVRAHGVWRRIALRRVHVD